MRHRVRHMHVATPVPAFKHCFRHVSAIRIAMHRGISLQKVRVDKLQFMGSSYIRMQPICSATSPNKLRYDFINIDDEASVAKGAASAVKEESFLEEDGRFGYLAHSFSAFFSSMLPVCFPF
jgi:hypothetical protein